MPVAFHLSLGFLVQFAGCCWVLWRGDAAARWTALVVLVANVVGFAAQDRVFWHDPQHRMLLLDTVQLAAFTAILTRHRRRWLFAAAIAQLMAAGVDAVMAVDPLVDAWAWLTVTIGCGWVVFLCVLIGGLRRRSAPDLRHVRGWSGAVGED